MYSRVWESNDEPQGEACMTAIEEADRLLISAGTVAEALLVASRRNVGEEVEPLSRVEQS